jgi:hypothetical protein
MKYSSEVKAIARAIIEHEGTTERASVSQLLFDIESDFCNDFEVCYESREYRIINNDDIQSTMEDELSSDEYILGCFNSWFLSEITGIDSEVFDAMKQSEAFEAIGKLIISGGYLEELAEGYISADGAGHHFSHYDFSEDDTGDYTVFCIN